MTGDRDEFAVGVSGHPENPRNVDPRELTAAQLRRMIDHADVVTFLLDVTGTVVSHSAALTRSLGHDVEAMQGRALTSIVAPADRARVSDLIAGLARRHGDGVIHRQTIEVGLLASRRSESVPYELTIVDLHDDPISPGFVVTAHDVSRLRAVGRALEHQALHDELTDLANRRLLMQQLQAWQDLLVTYAVAYLDIDRFASVNDLFGRESGDRVLRNVAARLVDAMDRYRGAIVARVNGNEFVVAAPVDDQTADVACATLIASVAEVFEHPIYLGSGAINLTASIGGAYSDGHKASEDVIAHAEEAMQIRKRDSHGRPLLKVGDQRSRRELADDLVGAIDRGEIVVHYQSIVDLLTRDIVGVEALVRWNHPLRGLLAPGAFLPTAQELGLDIDIDRFVLRTATHAVARRIAEHGREFRLMVNMSSALVSDPATPDYVASLLARSGLEPHLLWLEITEDAFLQPSTISHESTTLTNVKRLEQVGVRLAIDDFGTSFPSLSRLATYPITMVKIDRSFVSGMPDDPRSVAIVESLLVLAQRMNVVAVAQGVERPEQLNELAELGCRLGQGFLFGRPGPGLPGDMQSTPARVLLLRP